MSWFGLGSGAKSTRIGQRESQTSGIPGPIRKLELIQKIQQDRYCRSAAHYVSKTLAAVGAITTIPLREGHFP
jgi:hypothetical protein